MWYFENSRYAASTGTLICVGTTMPEHIASSPSFKWAFRKWLHLGHMSGYSVYFLKSLYLMYWVTLFKEPIFNVLGNPSFIFTVYNRSGLNGWTPSPKRVTPTRFLPLPKRETNDSTVYTSLIQTVGGTHFLLAVGLSNIFFSVHQPLSSLDEGC